MGFGWELHSSLLIAALFWQGSIPLDSHLPLLLNADRDMV